MSKPSFETPESNQTRDPDLAAAEIAMRRAAQRARERARRAGGGAIVWQDDQIIEEQPEGTRSTSLMGR